jgi:hypothetical protein
MRGLSENFMKELKSGFLSGIIQKVRKDKDLDLQIRENNINIYYKGNALLKLKEIKTKRTYRVTINPKFKSSLDIPNYLHDTETTEKFLSIVPSLKENIVKEASSSLEAEYEQEIIRANNNERKINSEYFIVDRQYTDIKPNTDERIRIDLTGFFWDGRNRRSNQTVPLCIMEIKFGLNGDIKDVHKQIDSYYQSIKKDTKGKAKEAKKVFGQKLELNLINHRSVEALETLSFSGNIEDYQFIIILVDYNPYGRSFKKAVSELKKLPFANQIRIFRSGLAIWREDLSSLE